MKTILLLAPSNYDYTIYIKKELEKSGNHIIYVEDRLFKFDPLLSPNNCIKKIAKTIIGTAKKEKEAFWNETIKKYRLDEMPVDVFFAINPCSITSTIIDLLNKNNPDIKKYIYLWDSCNMFAFDKYFKYFDSCFTFDRNDSQRFNINYLPMMWMPVEKQEEIKYDAFFVGTIHGDRLFVLDTLIEEFKKNKVKYFIKLYVPFRKSILDFIKYHCNILLNKRGVINDIYEINTGKIQRDYIIRKHISLNDFNKYISESKCIIDIEQECQSAVTPRTIQALSMNKRIISTNKTLAKEDFYSPDYIQIIDRNNPIITTDFLNADMKSSDRILEGILKLRIDNWVKQIIKN